MGDNDYLGFSTEQSMNDNNDYLGFVSQQNVNKVNPYLGNIEKSRDAVDASIYLGNSATPKSTSDTQGMEYMPDIDNLSKEQLQQLKDELLRSKNEEELPHYNGYGR